MEHSEAINELAEAIALAQGAMGEAFKTHDNPFYKSKYAGLAEVRRAGRKPLADNGLAVIQSISNCDVGVRVTTMLTHKSGQWVRDSIDVPAAKLDAQGLGSAASYGLRYSLQAITGIAPDDESDDDGNAVRGADAKRPASKAPAKAAPKPPILDTIIVTLNNAQTPEHLRKIGDRLEELTSEEITDADRKKAKTLLAARAMELAEPIESPEPEPVEI